MVPKMLTTHDGCKEVCRILFKNAKGEPYELYNYQVPIIQGLFFGHPKPKNFCTATTRAGKSEALGIAFVLVANFKMGEKLRLVAPTDDQKKIVMTYVIQHSLDNEFCANNLMWDVKGSGAERLRKTVSKDKLTWWNGNDLMAISANILAEGRSLIGWGGTTIGVDEAELIPAVIMRTTVMRMLGDSPDSILFLIGNPIKYGYMYDKQTDPDWNHIKINCWDCVKEGRLSMKFVKDREADMLPNEFKAWYLGEWPDEVQNQLFVLKALKKMFAPLTHEELELLKTEPDEKHLGIDIARFGNDFTVLQPRYKYGEINFLMPQSKFEKQGTMKTVGEAINLDRRDNFVFINADDPGVGGGVVDRLKEINQTSSRTVSFCPGESPHKLPKKVIMNKKQEEDNKRFLNKKAFWYMNFARLALEGKVRVVPSEHTQILHNQLKQLFYEFTSNGHMKITEEEEKSPDFADAANISLFQLRQPMIFTTT